MIQSQALTDALAGTIFRTVISVEETDSTNSFALASAASGEDEGLVVLADRQTAGRGRHGRSWFSPPGTNIHMSLLLRPYLNARDASLLTIMTAVGACAALREAAHCDAGIQWPNDIVLNGKKLGGILIEAKTENRLVIIAVIGIGINVNVLITELPDEIKASATSLRAEIGTVFEREKITLALLKNIDSLHRTLFSRHAGSLERSVRRSARDMLIHRWKELDMTLGKSIAVKTSRGVLRGKAMDVDGYGMLHVMTADGRIVKIHAGDISIED